MQYLVYIVKCSVCGMQLAVFSVQCVVCSVECSVCSVQCAVCIVQCAMYLYRALFSVHCLVYCAGPEIDQDDANYLRLLPRLFPASHARQRGR